MFFHDFMKVNIPIEMEQCSKPFCGNMKTDNEYKYNSKPNARIKQNLQNKACSHSFSKYLLKHLPYGSMTQALET